MKSILNASNTKFIEVNDDEVSLTKTVTALPSISTYAGIYTALTLFR
jgi:hypothetical protein